MIKIDTNKIAEILERHGVVVGYLFGSAVRGNMGLHSDIDVAVLFDEKKIPAEKQFDEKLAISSDIMRVFGVRDADVINLRETTNPVLRHEAVLQGEAILVKDREAKARLARTVLREFEDTRYLRETAYKILREQARSGEFGHAPATLKKYVSAQ